MNAPATFSKNGYTYQLLQHQGRIALYKALSQPDACPRSFEAHIMRVWPERTINGKLVASSPRLASNEEFGRFAWSYTSLEAATERFNVLVKKAVENHEKVSQ